MLGIGCREDVVLVKVPSTMFCFICSVSWIDFNVAHFVFMVKRKFEIFFSFTVLIVNMVLTSMFTHDVLHQLCFFMRK